MMACGGWSGKAQSPPSGTGEREVAIPPATRWWLRDAVRMRISGLPAPLHLSTSPVRRTADSKPGWPCRRCLRDAEVGEVLLLVSYDPWTTDSPYRQPGPVLVHERDCEPWTGDELPRQLTSRLLSVRVVDHQGMQVAGKVVPGDELAVELERRLADPGTAFVHLHNAGPGCFAARVDRS